MKLHLVLILALLSNIIDGLSTTGQVVLVTGANKGIGKEICRFLATDPSVSATILACRSLERAEEAMQELHADGCENLYCVAYDLSKPKMAEQVQNFVRTKFGRLDVLIHNAAVCFNDPTLYGKVSYTPFQQQASITVQTNFFGTWRLTQALIPLLLRSNSDPAKIITIASYAGRLAILQNSPDLTQKFTSPQLTMPQLESLAQNFITAVEDGTHAQQGWPNTCYGLSKLALIAMTRVLAREFAKPVQSASEATDGASVNVSDNRSWIACYSVDPGYCATDQNQYSGTRSALQGATTPCWLATTQEDKNLVPGSHWFDKQIIEW